MTEFCKAANRAGLQIEMHAIGDKAFVQAVRAIKAALDDLPREDHRHTIIHACLPTAEEIAVCERYHINLAVQTAHNAFSISQLVIDTLHIGIGRIIGQAHGFQALAADFVHPL